MSVEGVGVCGAFIFLIMSLGEGGCSPGGSPLRRGRLSSPSYGWELPSAPDTMLQTLKEYPGQRPLLFLWNSVLQPCNLGPLGTGSGACLAVGEPQLPLSSLLHVSGFP